MKPMYSSIIHFNKILTLSMLNFIKRFKVAFVEREVIYE